MAYYCSDCSYLGGARSDTGGCPACGSFNLRNREAREILTEKRGSKWRLGLVVILWAYLLLEVYRKLYL